MSDDRNDKINGVDGFLGGFDLEDDTGSRSKGQYSYRGYSGYGSSFYTGKKRSDDSLPDNNRFDNAVNIDRTSDGFGGYSGNTPQPSDGFGGYSGTFSQTGESMQGSVNDRSSSDGYVPVRGTFDTFNNSGYQPIRGNAANSMTKGGADTPASRKKAGIMALIKSCVIMFVLLSFMLPILIPAINNYFYHKKEENRYEAVEAVYSDVVKVSIGMDANKKPKYSYVAYVDYTFNGTRYNDKYVQVASENVKGDKIKIYVDRESPSTFYSSMPESAKKGQTLLPILILVGFILICMICMIMGVYRSFKGKSRKKSKAYSGGYTGSSGFSAAAPTSTVMDNGMENRQVTYNSSGNSKGNSAGYILFMAVGFIFAAIGFVGLISSLVADIKNSNMIKSAIEIEATCTRNYSTVDGGQLKFNGRSVNFMIDAEYEYEGKTYTKTRLVVYEPLHKGQKFFAYILPNDPRECFTKRSSSAQTGFLFLFGMFAFLGSVFFIIGLRYFIKFRKAKKNARK